MNPRQRYEYMAEVLGKWVLTCDEDGTRDGFWTSPGTKARLEALRAAEAECGLPMSR